MTSKRISRPRCASISIGRSTWSRRWRATAMRDSPSSNAERVIHMNNHDPEGVRRVVEEMDAELKAARAAHPKPAVNGAPSNIMSHLQTGVAYRALVGMNAGGVGGG